MCLMEKIYVLDKFHLSMSYSAVDHEFNVNESEIYIKLSSLKLKYTEDKVMYWWADENVTMAPGSLTLYFPWRQWSSICYSVFVVAL